MTDIKEHEYFKDILKEFVQYVKFEGTDKLPNGVDKEVAIICNIRGFIFDMSLQKSPYLDILIPILKEQFIK